MSTDLRKRITWLILFSIAMGFLETTVVVYLRELYYPNGFSFPLTVMDERIGMIELLREAATVIMLLGVGFLAGSTFNQRFAFFMAAFAIWDIFYYVFLKILLDWPESLLTWDILFLIPFPWIGPVLAPCLISLTMLILAAALVYRDSLSQNHKLQLREWSFLIVGSLVVIASWTLDYLAFNQGKDSMIAISTYVPITYNWFVFAAGEGLLLVVIVLFWRRTSSE
jgi:uncharacterized membrane protein